MASNYTAHYGFCQWEPKDHFIRCDFNGDNAKLDGALYGLDGRTAAMEQALPLVSYNVYQLFLQHYYEGKKSGAKKALIFDGFADGSMIAAMTPSVARLNNRLALMRTGQGDVSLGPYGGTPPPAVNTQSTPTCTATGYGTLTGAVVKTVNLVSEARVMAHWECKAYLNKELIRDVTMPLYCNANSVAAEQELSLGSHAIKPGDTFYMTMKANNTNHQVFWNSVGQIGGRFKITPIGGASGTVTTPVLDLPDRRALRAWLRFRGGSVLLSAKSGSTDHPLTVAATRQTVNLQGESCTEQELRLDPAPASGTLAFSLGLTLGADNSMDVFDYGVMLI